MWERVHNTSFGVTFENIVIVLVIRVHGGIFVVLGELMVFGKGLIGVLQTLLVFWTVYIPAPLNGW